MKRLRAACRTNDVQARAVIFMTIMMLLATASRESSPLWLWAFSLLFWPMLALIFNLIDPIPDEKDQHGKP